MEFKEIDNEVLEVEKWRNVTAALIVLDAVGNAYTVTPFVDGGMVWATNKVCAFYNDDYGALLFPCPLSEFKRYAVIGIGERYSYQEGK